MNSALLAIAGVFLLGTSAPGPRAVSQFHMTVARTATGWAMHCDHGCAWRELSVGCTDGACQVRVDSTGVSMDLKAPAVQSGFAFVLVPDGPAGWAAEGRAGTAWSRTSWGCGAVPCTGRLDAIGVSGR